MLKKLMVYHFGKNCTEIARYKYMLKGYELTGIVSPNGWGYTGKDVAQLDRGKETNIVITNDFDACIETCDAIYVHDEPGFDLPIHHIEKIKLALTNQKEILIPKSLEKIFSKHGIHENQYTVVNKDVECKEIHKLVNIDVPVILIYGAGEHTNKFHIQLLLRKFFENCGYSVSQIGSKPFSSLFGFESLPNYLYDVGYSVEDKIKSFNDYVKNKVKREDTDLLIIGVSGGCMPSFHNDVDNFGVLPFIIGQAVKPDVSIMSLYFNQFKNQHYKGLQLHSKYKYNCITERFHISNVKVAKTTEDIKAVSAYTYLDREYVLDHLSKEKNEFEIFNIFDEDAMKEICESVFNELVGNTYSSAV